MEYNSHLKNCRNDDVISFGAELYKFSKFSVALISAIKKIGNVVVGSLDSDGIKDTKIYVSTTDYRHRSYEDNSRWLNDGIPCEILIPTDTNGWQTGKVRMKVILEFCPDRTPVEQSENIFLTAIDTNVKAAVKPNEKPNSTSTISSPLLPEEQTTSATCKLRLNPRIKPTILRIANCELSNWILYRSLYNSWRSANMTN